MIFRAGLCCMVVHASSNEVSAGIASAAVGSAMDVLRALSTRFATFIDIFSCNKLINDVCYDKIKTTRTKQRQFALQVKTRPQLLTQTVFSLRWKFSTSFLKAAPNLPCIFFVAFSFFQEDPVGEPTSLAATSTRPCCEPPTSALMDLNALHVNF